MHFSQLWKLRDLDLDLRSGRGHAGLPTHQIRWKSEKLFVDIRTYGRTHLSSNLLGHRRGDDLKIINSVQTMLFICRNLVKIIFKFNRQSNVSILQMFASVMMSTEFANTISFLLTMA